MNAPLRYGIAIFASYFVAWTVAYSIVTYNAVRRLDFTQYFTWLVLAWNFTGFEMVAVTWLLSIAIFIPLVIAAIFLVRKRARREQASQRLQTAVSSGAETASEPIFSSP